MHTPTDFTHLTTTHPPLNTAAPSTARLVTMIKVQCAALGATSKTRYLSTMLKFSEWCDKEHMLWHSASAGLWLTTIQLGGNKPLAENTLLQKVTHLNFLTDLSPPLLPGGKISLSKLVQGLAKFSTHSSLENMLPPSFLISLSLLEQPQLIHIAIQLQASIGLRAGQMTMITPMHLLTPGQLIAPPFKLQKFTVLLSVEHVPVWLIHAFLSFQQNGFSPILPWTTPQYRAKFKEVCVTYKLPQTSHAARHTYASVHRFLNEPLPMISQILIHKGADTVETYLHAISLAEQKIIMEHPDYFKARRLVATKSKAKRVH